jgi:serine/threonine protein kinase
MMWGEGTRAGAAVVIGVGEYLHAERVRPLRFAARDAEAVAGALIDPSVCGFPAEKVKLLTDADACRDALAHHLSKWLPEQAKQAEIVVIYFAGHGTIHGVGRREEGYLLAHDVDPEDLVTRGILMADLSRWIESIDADAVVVCLDCCHAAKVIPRGGPTDDVPARDMRIPPAMLQALAGRGRYLIASCDDGQVSVEAECWGHGLFTHHLLAGLRGAGDRDEDGRVGIAEFFEYVSEAVERDARAMGILQKPWISATGPGGVILATRTAKGERPRGAARRPTHLGDAERLWREQGSAAAVRAIERAMDAAPAEELIPALELLGTMRDPAAVPLLFRCLAHSSDAVRGRAKQIIQAFGWQQVTATIKDLARRGDEAHAGPILDGLAAYEAHEEIVGLLDQISTLLKDNLRNRAILLLERKRQGLEFEQVAALFRESGSPYQILKPLGQGLFTAAYLARDEPNELDVVIRVLRAEFAAWPQIRAQFLDLARRSVKLVHHNLVLTRDVRDFAERRIYYAVRDYVEGVTLQRLLETGRAFTPGQIIQILRQVVLALGPIHARGMVHGSIKPSNIFLCGEDRVVLGDLAIPAGGISIQLDRLSYDYRYAPPEMFRQAGQVGPWSDFYSLGCLAYELACGSPPFVSDNHFELAGKHEREHPVLPSRRGSVLGLAGDPPILGLLAKIQEERLADPAAVLRALDELNLALRPQVKDSSPPDPILGEASLIRYSTDQMFSILSFTTDPRAFGQAEGNAGPPSESLQYKLDRARPPRVQITYDVEIAGPEITAETPSETSLRPQTEEDVTQKDFALGGKASSDVVDAMPDATGDSGGDDRDSMPKALRRYTIIEKIASGGQGAVYLARDEALNRQVAIKLNATRSRLTSDVPSRFRLEARAVARLHHPNIVAIYDVGEMDDSTYTVLQYVDGGDLRRRMDESPWSAEAAVRLVVTLAHAVHYAHSHGIVHRDLKPSNILLTREGVPRISDFGLAKLEGEREEDSSRTLEGTVIGTPSYMAPEQAMGEIREVGPATDIYALGTILYELLAGRRPFQGGTILEMLIQVRERRPDPPSRWKPGLPPQLDAICLRCLEKSPRDRYATAAELADALERFLEKPSISRATSFWDRAWGLLPFKKTERGKNRQGS